MIDKAMALISSTQAARVLGVKPQTLAVWRLRGRGPKFVRFGGPKGRVSYSKTALQEWIAARTYSSTSEETVGIDTAGEKAS